MKTYLILLNIMLFFVMGCGVIIHGTKQDLRIVTDPSGLTAIVASKSCITPCILNVSRKNEHIVIVKQDGESFYTDLEREFNLGVIPGNFWNYFIGVAIDHVSGAAWTIEDVNIKFPKTTALKVVTEGKETTDKNVK